MEYSVSQYSPLNLSYALRHPTSMISMITQWQLKFSMFKSELGPWLQRKKSIKVNDDLGLQSYTLMGIKEDDAGTKEKVIRE